LSSMILSADLVKGSFNLHVIIGLLALNIPRCRSDFRCVQVIHTHAGRAADHLIRGVLINPCCAHPGGMGNLEYRVHSKKTVRVNLNATLAGIERQLRWINSSTAI